ncbi:hypothetical protein ACOSQ4_012557 [Xanthoceras sorbifolium]
MQNPKKKKKKKKLKTQPLPPKSKQMKEGIKVPLRDTRSTPVVLATALSTAVDEGEGGELEGGEANWETGAKLG